MEHEHDCSSLYHSKVKHAEAAHSMNVCVSDCDDGGQPVTASVAQETQQLLDVMSSICLIRQIINISIFSLNN